MTKPDALAAIAEADKALMPSVEVSGVARETTYELAGLPYVNSSNIAERNATMVTRDFTGYSDRIVQRDGHHDFPFMKLYRKWIVTRDKDGNYDKNIRYLDSDL